jgi:hypothetical protein
LILKIMNNFSVVRTKIYLRSVLCLVPFACSLHAFSQSADWQNVIYREPQVRYLLADMCMGGNANQYVQYATVERDPDSREAVRLFTSGARVLNTNDFERKWIPNVHGKDGRVMRIVFRGTQRTITGNEVLLTSDLGFHQDAMRVVLAALTLGCPVSAYEAQRQTPEVAEALRRWRAGARASNSKQFEARGKGHHRRVVYRGLNQPIDGRLVILNSDAVYPETNVRYFMADIVLGGGIEFYRNVAEAAHEMGCLEAVKRTEEGYRITNLDQFERKKINGQTLITRKGSLERISGMEVKLSSDD